MTGVPSGIPPDCLRLLLYYKNNTSGSYDKPAESSVALRVAAHGMLANAAAAAIGRRGLQDRAWMEVAGTTPSASGCPTLCSARLWANRRGGGTDDHRHGPVRKPGPARARLPPPALDQEPARPQASAPGHLSDRDMHERRRRPAGRVARTRPAAKAEHLGSQAQPLCSGIPQVRLGTREVRPWAVVCMKVANVTARCGLAGQDPHTSRGWKEDRQCPISKASTKSPSRTAGGTAA
jgi:hypothetical protein